MWLGSEALEGDFENATCMVLDVPPSDVTTAYEAGRRGVLLYGSPAAVAALNAIETDVIAPVRRELAPFDVLDSSDRADALDGAWAEYWAARDEFIMVMCIDLPVTEGACDFIVPQDEP